MAAGDFWCALSCEIAIFSPRTAKNDKSIEDWTSRPGKNAKSIEDWTSRTPANDKSIEDWTSHGPLQVPPPHDSGQTNQNQYNNTLFSPMF